MAARVGPNFGTTIMGETLTPGLQTATDIATQTAANTAGITGQSLMDKVGGAIVDAIPKTPESIGRAIGTGLGGLASDAMIQDKLQSENIPKEVKDAETVQKNFQQVNYKT